MDIKIKSKHAIYLFSIVLCMFLSGCNNTNSNQGCESEMQVEKRDEEFFKAINYGESFENLEKQIGKPSYYDGNIKKYPVYDLVDGGYAIVLHFKDKIRVVEIYDKNEEVVYSCNRFSLEEDLKEEKSDAVLEDFDEIEWDFDYRDLVMTVGDPNTMIGSGITTYVYVLKDGTTVNIVPDMSKGGIFRISQCDKDGKNSQSRTRGK